MIDISASEAMASDLLFGRYFAGASWDRWRAVIKAAFAEPLTDAELGLFREVASRDPPSRRVKELAAIVGRGGGKDSIASLIATCAAINFDPRGKLRPGETATVMCLACDRAQAGIVFRYIKAYFETIPALRSLVIDWGSESIELRNGVIIEVHTNNFRAVRGRSLLCVIFDELAFWRDENFASPDVEVHGAVTPGLGRVPHSMLIMISSAHKRSGLLYQRHKDHFGKNDDDVLVVHGSTLAFNPSFDAATIDRAIEEDPQRYRAEYLSQWRDDLASYIGRDLLDAAVDNGVIVRPPARDARYVAGCDASGGRNDSFTAAISHRDRDGKIILDMLFERRPPFNPSEVVDEIAALLRQYRCGRITGDNYAAGWVEGSFQKAGVRYIKSDRDRSHVYMDCLPIFASGRARLLDCPKLLSQFAALERRRFSTGRERIDPGPGHDDLANSAAIAMSLCAGSKNEPFIISDEALAMFGPPARERRYSGGYYSGHYGDCTPLRRW
jgi:hypothetical protein